MIKMCNYKKITCILVALFTMLTFISVAFATDNTLYPVNVYKFNQYTDIANNGTVVGIYQNNDVKLGTPTSNEVYAFSLINGQYTEYYIASNDSTSFASASYLECDGRYFPQDERNQFDNTTNMYYCKFNIGAPAAYSTPTVVTYSTLNEGLVQCKTIIENGGVIPEPENPTTINYELPAGNVAYIKIANSFDGFGLTTTMPVKSDAFSSTTGWNTTQRWGFTDNIATNGTQLTNFGSQISWSKNTNQTNIFGQTQEAYFYPEGPFVQSEYLVIVNPLYYAIQYTNGEGVFPSDSGVNQTVNNNSIHINCDDAISITVFQLTQNVTINNNIPSYTNNVSSNPYEGEIDPDTGDITWTDPNGGNNQPTTGGGNVPGTGESSFMSVINGIANRIVNVFQPAHDAIITLSNAVTNFAGWLYELYVWLPAPILTLLTSAISVAIIIGVIKVFI